MSASRGILYVATGEKYAAEAARSAESAKKHMPDLPICLYTDIANPGSRAFDEVRTIQNPRHFFVDKVEPLLHTPFERTLFLDTDTFVCHPVGDVFDLLDRFDIALAHAPMRHDRAYPTPNCFAEMNSGVIAYRRNEKVAAMFRRWMEIYDKELRENKVPEIGDQVHLRQAIYGSEVSPYILPPEYNFRSVMLGSCARQKVRILHGRGDLERIARQVNASNKMRVVFPALDMFNPDQAIFLDRPGRVFGNVMGGFIAMLARWRRKLRKNTAE